ncbi:MULTISPECIES: hypothetical protein [Paenibacillus]|uniref:Uncharacterized protein n=2 Tax=Paenibacillus TaxID=44249 RepID=A0A7Y6EUJ0_9BACL|nr:MULTISPECIES: hypothetical protein [Paenibacillus]KGP81916.1 hypothetical protein P364_0113895 [Paenibacillus sp. MAEPY2]KGP87348.1 hypothetical protein P363_0112395 [Paenibacillus sp. MAEPY1]MDN4603828.1 hypothetical protein [Paenibacillus vandeheii]NUU75701.1 hypothetical protein [Paenibacillus xylanilyticus]
MNEKLKLKAGIEIATVTANGILFNGRMYTNREVIKKKWFDAARDQGEWKIPIVHIKDYQEAILIISIKFQEVSVATWVSLEKRNVKDVNEYHDRLNQLKQLKKSIRKQIN